jgi:hypothetical protein
MDRLMVSKKSVEKDKKSTLMVVAHNVMILQRLVATGIVVLSQSVGTMKLSTLMELVLNASIIGLLGQTSELVSSLNVPSFKRLELKADAKLVHFIRGVLTANSSVRKGLANREKN